MNNVDWIELSPHASLIHALRAVAWADHVVEDEEIIWASQLLERLGVEVNQEVFRHWMNTRPPDRSPEESDTFNRLFLLDEAVRLAWADGSYDATERKRIARWARQWSVSDAKLEAIEADVAASANSELLE